MIEVSLLGTGGMLPLPNRFLTSLYCRIKGRYILIDCGEGTQISLKALGWGFKNLDIICFTHFHADHISGLPGLLLTLGNSGRTEPVYMLGPIGLKEIVEKLCSIASEIQFEIRVIEYSEANEIQINGCTISALPVDHSIECLAYNIYLPRQGKFDVEKAKSLNLPKRFWSKLQMGEEIEYEGKTFTSDMVLGEKRTGIKISYCTDSRPVDELVEFVSKSDLFVCEGIYGEDSKIPKAVSKKHMVFSEAATIAKKAEAKELWLTHFSPSMPNPEDYLTSATNIFENTIICHDRICKTILFPAR